MKRLVLVLALLASSTASAQAPPSFAKGVLAFEKGDYAAAETLLREAVAGNPNEVDGTVRISGQWFETYVPHYFLARALAKQRKCAEAIRHFEESERQGVTPTISDFARHLKTRGGCKPQSTKEAPPKQTIDVTVPFGEEEVVPAKPTAQSPQPPAQQKPQQQSQPAPPPNRERERQQLLRGVQEYLAGNYDQSVRALDRRFTDPTLNAEAALFRAASRHALYRLKRESALVNPIAADIATYRQLRPNAKPDARMFAPSFMRLVE